MNKKHKNIFATTVLLGLILGNPLLVCAYDDIVPLKADIVQSNIIPKQKENIENVSLNLENKEKLTLNLTNSATKTKNNIVEVNSQKIKEAFEIQKKNDVEDIKILWDATIERNEVIKFALKKLATPADQRRFQSSLMAKSVSALISGTSLLPGFFGLNAAASTASAASGRLANAVIQKKMQPKDMPITDTELIQIAGLIEELQNDIIKGYYDYKNSLDSLIVARQKLIIENRNYSEALKSGNEFTIIASSAAYDKSLLDELKLKQQTKLYRLQLERLAGPVTVANLNLIRVATADVKNNGLNK